MNKKFSTLMALALLAGSFPVAAQFCPVPNGEVPYRSRFVKAADLDASFQDVSKINQEYYYQLEVDPETLPFDEKEKGNGEKGTFVLAVERDYSTGKLYLTAQKVTNATLTHTLWKIKVTDRAANGRVYSYVNKETGFELSFDHTNALQINHEGSSYSIIVPGSYDEEDPNKANAGWNYLKDGLNGGCISNWAWYTTDDVADKNLGYKKIYSYFHNQADSVMTLAAVRNSTDRNNNLGHDLVYKYSQIQALSDNQGNFHNDYDGLNGSIEGGFAIVAVKDAKAPADDFIKGIGASPIKIRPVVAGAKVLNAAEINSMIDADGSWLNFKTDQNSLISTYGDEGLKDGDKGWNDADNNNDENSKFAKFTVLKPGTNEPLNVVEGANPFAHAFEDGKFLAESVYDNLARDNFNADNKSIAPKANGNAFAGYDILLRTNDPIQTAGDRNQYGYLYVSEHTYETKTATSNHDGLKVLIQPYAYIDGGTRVTVDDVKKATSSIAKGYPDALEARYHWKVTYYATQDSLVLEPLNASRMNTQEMKDETPFEKSHLADEYSNWWVNTVNKATVYANGNEEGHNNNDKSANGGNWMSEKVAGVPVALFAMNNSSVGDDAQLLTIGTPTNAEAGNSNYAAAVKTEDGNPAYVTNKSGEKITPYQAAMNLRLKFNHTYPSLTRTTVEDGLYFINLVKPGLSNAQTEHRVDGAYIVYDMEGHMVYDVQEEGQQDFTHMPATQWVVEQQPCVKGDELNNNETPVVRVINREYDDVLFDGQLYKDSEGRLFTINHRDYAWLASQTNVDHHYRKDFNCNDRVAFNKIENPTIEGYFNAEEDVLRENVYTFQHMFNNGLGQSLVDVDGKLKVGENGTEFELFRCGVYVAEPHMVEQFNPETGAKELVENGNWDIKYKETQNYGHTNAEIGAEQLQKTFYKIKVKDDNLIDNDHKFVAINNQYKYVIATESEIEKDANLSYAIVSLKENNCLDGTHGYAIVNKPIITEATAGVKEFNDLSYAFGKDENGKDKDVIDEFGNPYGVYYVDNGDKVFDGGDKDIVVFEVGKNNYQTWGKLAIEAVSLDTKISDLCETSTDAFALVKNNRPLYRDLATTGYADLVNNNKKAIDIRTIDEQGNASLYEDSNSPKALANKLNYLASETMGDPTQNEGFYVDKVAKSNGRMPQYLFAVAADSVPAYTYCNCQISGHNQHGVNAGCGHEEEFAGYVEGRFLVNFNDSIAKYMSNIDKDPIKANKFASDNYVRLGFVEAVHRGDSLYVLKAPYTLASLKIASQDPAENGKMYICPDSLAADKEGIIYDIVELNGKHNNVAFSLRNTGNDGEFLIESNGPSSAIGSFTGAWIKIHNYVPVLARFADENGNHDTGDGTDSALDTEYVGNMDEVINQSARFVLSAMDKDSQATANEEISTSSVVVAGVDGAVVVKGAEGKNVIVSTILGKVVANEVVSSDNATIAAPQGVVVVSVDGESFKVVVK